MTPTRRASEASLYGKTSLARRVGVSRWRVGLVFLAGASGWCFSLARRVGVSKPVDRADEACRLKVIAC
jgi:hypothetical protein